MARLDLAGVSKNYGATRVLADIDLSIPDGAFTVFVGPSGCGKSTLLRMICGLDAVSGGTVAINGEIVNDVPAAKRGIAMVFQSYALYPHMSVARNMGYALRLAGTPSAEIDRRVREAAAILRIEPLLERKPRQLSGGQRQRVAIGRAIVREPRIFLFDEPLSNLDAALRVEMRFELARLKQRLGTTTIYVTHDQTEAMTLADQIVVMRDGRIEQVGSPLDLYRSPVNQFVAGFIGSPRMNFLPARIVGTEGGDAIIAIENVTLRTQGLAPKDGGEAVAGIRPEHIVLARRDRAGSIAAKIVMVEQLGSDTFVYVERQAGGEPLLVRAGGELDVSQGSEVGLVFDPQQIHLFDRAGLALKRFPTLEAVA